MNLDHPWNWVQKVEVITSFVSIIDDPFSCIISPKYFKLISPTMIIQSKCHFQTISDQCKWQILWRWGSLPFEANCTRNLNTSIYLTNKRWRSPEVGGCYFRASGPGALRHRESYRAVLYNVGRKSVFAIDFLRKGSQTHLGWGQCMIECHMLKHGCSFLRCCTR